MVTEAALGGPNFALGANEFTFVSSGCPARARASTLRS